MSKSRTRPTLKVVEHITRPEQRLSFRLCRRERDGKLYDFVIQVRSTQTKDRFFKQHRFDDGQEAQRAFKAFQASYERAVSTHADSVKDLEELARSVVFNGDRYAGQISVQFLLALDRVRNASKNPSYHAVANGIVSILGEHNRIQVEDFNKWLTAVVRLLLTRHSSATSVVSEDTARHRLRFLQRALKCVSDYSALTA